MRLTFATATGIIAALSLSACSTVGQRTSPWVYGVDLRVAPAIRLGSNASPTFHPTVAYARSMFGGVDGETGNAFHLGGQVRSTLPGCSASQSCFWLGAEATVGHLKVTFDDGSDSETRNGWTVAGLAGVPVYTNSAWTINAYAAGGMVKWGGSGPYFRVGLDFQPDFLRR